MFADGEDVGGRAEADLRGERVGAGERVASACGSICGKTLVSDAAASTLICASDRCDAANDAVTAIRQTATRATATEICFFMILISSGRGRGTRTPSARSSGNGNETPTGWSIVISEKTLRCCDSLAAIRAAVVCRSGMLSSPTAPR